MGTSSVGRLLVAKAMTKELKKAIRDALENVINQKPEDPPIFRGRQRGLVLEAVDYLRYKGALDPTTNRLRLTAYGREYWEQLTAPRRYFLQKNWFRIAGLAVPLILGLTAIIANILF